MPTWVESVLLAEGRVGGGGREGPVGSWEGDGEGGGDWEREGDSGKAVGVGRGMGGRGW